MSQTDRLVVPQACKCLHTAPPNPESLHPKMQKHGSLGRRFRNSEANGEPKNLRRLGFTQRPHSSSFLGLPSRILDIAPKRNYYGALGQSVA